MLTCLAAQRICETKNSSSKPKNPGSTRFSQVRTLGRKKYELRMLFCSANFEESRVTCGSEDSGSLSLSETHASGNREAQSTNLPFQANVDSRCKGENGKGMKEGHKEGTLKQNIRKVHFFALVDIRHTQKYEHIPVNVRKSNHKCGNYENFTRSNH